MVNESQSFKNDSKEGGTQTQKDYWEMFQRSILDPSKEYPEPVSVLNLIQNEEKYVLLTSMSYSLWQGKSKSKKTTVLAMAIAAYISLKRSTECVRFEREGEVGKVLFIDTEQGESYASRTMKLILKIAGVESSENLIYCDFREYTPRDRLGMIHAALDNSPGVKIVVVDGVVDVMQDFMDAKEGHAVVTDLLRICSKYKVHVAGVLHQNKSKEDKNARGHVGTISGQKCEMEIACEVKNEVTEVECRASRGLPFQLFAIKWEKGKLPEIVQNYKQGENKRASLFKKNALAVHCLSNDDHKALIIEIFKDYNSEFNNGQLKDKIKESSLKEMWKVTDPIARQFVEYWSNKKLIVFRVGSRNANIYSLPLTERE